MTTENTDSSQKIDVEKIMEEIRADIKCKGYNNDMLSFSDVYVAPSDTFQKDVFDENVTDINNQWDIPYYRPIIGNPIKKFIQKVIRKLMKPVSFPVVIDQAEFNSRVASVMNQMKLYIETEQKEKELLIKKIEELQKKIEEK